MTKVAVSTLFSCAILAGCGTQPMVPSTGHIKEAPQPAGSIPAPVQQSAILAPPKPAPKSETYSVTVYRVPVQSLLFALARDAKVNIDVHPSIEGEVTLNAINQTLPQLLSRIAKQVDMRYELDGSNLVVLPDTPFLRNYKVDYVNMTRNSTSNVNIATQISTGSGALAASGGSGGDNNSRTSVSNTSNNRFWETLVQNIKDTLKEEDRLVVKSRSESTEQRQAGQDASGKPTANPSSVVVVGNQQPNQQGANQQVSENERAVSVIANPETGLIAVRATSRQHEKVQKFLDMVMSSAKRQVLIEATVIEVQLSDQYQQGINWSSLRNSATEGLSIGQAQVNNVALPSGVNTGTSAGLFTLNYINPGTRLGNLALTLQLLESFGKVKVLSSPKINVLNNQTALLKVVDNSVFFTVTATTTPAQVGIPATTTYTSELHTVPVGFVMSVTPQIADTDEVTINVRPSISRIVGYVQDPNPALANAAVPVVSSVPVIQTREMESILKVNSGQIAVMGGLMQDSVDNNKDAIPVLGKIPVIGNAFSYRNDTSKKSELVIFMRPLVVKDASMTGDFRDFRHMLPTNEPLGKNPYTEPVRLPAADTKAEGK
ncbi:MAG: pilus (MSHA type) biogenesis protein MshL [Proteobacteria bacterium]|nr:pilus (MSHA type) biogenesis protein MshL [Pseudomonadota bacterium]